MNTNTDSMRAYSLKPDCFFAPTYWNSLSSAWGQLQSVILFDLSDNAMNSLMPYVSIREGNSVLCSPAVLSDKAANKCLLSLTWYGSPFKVIYTSLDFNCFDLLSSCYESEPNTLDVHPLLTEAAPNLARASMLTSCDSRFLWCFSHDADAAVAMLPTESGGSGVRGT